MNLRSRVAKLEAKLPEDANRWQAVDDFLKLTTTEELRRFSMPRRPLPTPRLPCEKDHDLAKMIPAQLGWGAARVDGLFDGIASALASVTASDARYYVEH